MRFVVCVKPVPKPGTVKVDPETHSLRRESAELVINPPDRFALEWAVRLSETCGGEVVAVMMGPPNAEPLLRELYTLGADRLVLLSDRAFAGSDTLATSYVLSKAVERLSPFELVLMGRASVDGETAQVGPETAAWLDLPSLTRVKGIRRAEGGWVAERVFEDFVEEVSFEAPAVLTVEPDSVTLRPPSFRRMLSSDEVSVEVLDSKALGCEESLVGLSGSKTRVLSVFSPSVELKREEVKGSPEEVVEKVVEFIKMRLGGEV